eukprot:403355961
MQDPLISQAADQAIQDEQVGQSDDRNSQDDEEELFHVPSHSPSKKKYDNPYFRDKLNKGHNYGSDKKHDDFLSDGNSAECQEGTQQDLMSKDNDQKLSPDELPKRNFQSEGLFGTARQAHVEADGSSVTGFYHGINKRFNSRGNSGAFVKANDSQQRMIDKMKEEQRLKKLARTQAREQFEELKVHQDGRVVRPEDDPNTQRAREQTEQAGTLKTQKVSIKNDSAKENQQKPKVGQTHLAKPKAVHTNPIKAKNGEAALMKSKNGQADTIKPQGGNPGETKVANKHHHCCDQVPTQIQQKQAKPAGGMKTQKQDNLKNKKVKGKGESSDQTLQNQMSQMSLVGADEKKVPQQNQRSQMPLAGERKVPQGVRAKTPTSAQRRQIQRRQQDEEDNEEEQITAKNPKKKPNQVKMKQIGVQMSKVETIRQIFRNFDKGHHE